MISVVLYGRNDNYGYNLHKRAALSLNCVAEVLTDSSDEILFVDYNTPDDFPTFPEAIQDTLTKRAREMLRIFRVRPRIHERFKPKTHLVALEPIARNVAVRRSHPSNRWILSTNTDMIFVPRGSDSLSQIARGLARGFYHAPRIEIPEVLWESFDRLAPANIIGTVREWGATLHLNEIILGSKFILYDAPGDFQLLLRSDLFENHGFHEGMLLGWHVDSNIAKRMYLKYGNVGDLGGGVYGYHCDHMRQVTPAHSHVRIQNDWRRFCDEVERPDLPEQADTWGCANDTIEEIRLLSNPATVYVQALRDAVGSPLAEARIVKYTGETYNKISYDPRHVLPFLADMFVPMPRSSTLAWYGAGMEMLSELALVWEKLGFTGKILADRDLVKRKDLAKSVRCVSTSETLGAADVFVFDFGDLPESPRAVPANSIPAHSQKQLSDELRRRFQRVVRAERRRLSDGLPLRRVIALNAINNEYEGLVGGYVAAAATPFATHMRHGYVLPVKPKEEWLPLLYIGHAGIRIVDRINSDPRSSGVITYGPYKFLDEGRYRLSIKIELSTEDLARPGNQPCIAVEVRAGAEVLGLYLIRREALKNPDHVFFFDVTAAAADRVEGVETRISLLSRVALSIRSVTVEPIPASSNEAGIDVSAAPVPIALQIAEWLPYLTVGPLGRMEDDSVFVSQGSAGFAAYGPYWTLPTGRYEMIVSIIPDAPSRDGRLVVTGDIAADNGKHLVVTCKWQLDRYQFADTPTVFRLPFTLANDLPAASREIETRIYSSGDASFRIRSVAVRVRSDESERNWFRYLAVGECGIHIGREIKSVDDKSGYIAYTPVMHIAPGRYKLLPNVVAVGADTPEKARVGMEIWSESGTIAIEARDAGNDQPLEFDVIEEIAEKGVELRIRTTARTAVSIRGLLIEKIAEGSAIQRRVWSSRRAVLRVRSMIVRRLKPLKPLAKFCVRIYAGAIKMVGTNVRRQD